MFTRNWPAAAILLVGTIAPTLALAAGPDAAPLCSLAEHQITSVAPYRTEERIGKATLQRLRGAELFVRAEPGLTAEWLQLTLQRHLQDMRTADMPGCALEGGVAHVEVKSAGAGFAVRLIAKDTRHAEEVLRRARLLVGA